MKACLKETKIMIIPNETKAKHDLLLFRNQEYPTSLDTIDTSLES